MCFKFSIFTLCYENQFIFISRKLQTLPTLFFIRTNLKEHKPEIWLKIKKKAEPEALSYNLHFGKRCRSFPPTNEHERSFPC